MLKSTPNLQKNEKSLRKTPELSKLKHRLLLNQTSVFLSKWAKSIYWHMVVMKESRAFICRVSSKKMCSKYLKDLNSPVFRQAIFKIKNKGKYLKCMIISWILQVVWVLINKMISSILIIILLAPSCFCHLGCGQQVSSCGPGFCKTTQRYVAPDCYLYPLKRN